MALFNIFHEEKCVYIMANINTINGIKAIPLK